ncbi:hypothetical protein Dimus_024541, partial [Dionaea muscipula]
LAASRCSLLHAAARRSRRGATSRCSPMIDPAAVACQGGSRLLATQAHCSPVEVFGCSTRWVLAAMMSTTMMVSYMEPLPWKPEPLNHHTAPLLAGPLVVARRPTGRRSPARRPNFPM